MSKIPSHIGIIMDGNRRWAKKRLFPTALGHREGAKRIESVVAYAFKKNVEYLTLWAFSTENWRRGEKEIAELMDVFRQMLNGPMIQKLQENNVRIQSLGELSAFPEDIVTKIDDITTKSEKNSGITLNFALNYGGRSEILRAVHLALKSSQKSLTEEEFGNLLYTKGQPDPELIIRTGGEKRLSGFLPWQTIYSELYFTDVLWPDFDDEEFEKAFTEYESRVRRFGK